MLSYFVLHTNNAKIAANVQTIDEYSYKQAKNIANSASQMIARKIMLPDGTNWPNFKGSTISTGSLLGEITNDYNDWSEWSELGGQFRIATLDKMNSDNDLLLVVAGKENFQDKDQFTRLILKENETKIPYWDYGVYAQQTILMNNPNPYIDSYSTATPDSAWSYMGEFQNAPVGTDLPYTSDDYPINRMDQIYGPDPMYAVGKPLPDIAIPGGACDPLTIANANATISSGVYRVDGGFSLTGNRTLTIVGDVTLYVTGNINTGGSSTIQIGNLANPNSSLTIYIDGNLDIGGTGFVNSSAVPSNLQIFGTPNCTSLDFRGTSDTHAAIYAPNADTKLLGTTKYFGAVVCKSMEMVGTISFHYDEALGGDPTLGYDSAFKFYIASWE